MKLSEVRRRIIGILADGEFHSGTQLSNVLGISRSAVWKQLKVLNEMGIEANAVSGKGYRLAKPIELLDMSRIKSGLSREAGSLISILEIHDQIDSTNSYLSDRARRNDTTGMVCLAEYQTAGKGRRGRHWVSPFGSNLYLSVMWRFQSGPAAVSGLSLAVGVALIRALRYFDIHDTGLKWPNDIYWNKKKLGGILVEVAGEAGGPCTVVVGVGLNMSLSLRDADSITQDWTDLSRMPGGITPSRNTLAARVINELIAVIAQYDQVGLSEYIDEWRSCDCMQGNEVTLETGNRTLSGIVQGINDEGMLLIRHSDGSEKVYVSGDVSFKIRKD